MNELDTQILSLTDQEVRAALMILSAKHQTEASEVIGNVLSITRKAK
jgi:hypothetical protein